MSAPRWSDEKLEEFRREFLEHRDKVEKWIDKEFAEHARDEHARLEALERAFPRDAEGAPDFVGHRTAHDAWIARANAETEFWKSAKAELMKGGIRGLILLIGLIVGLAIYGAKTKLGIPP